MLQKIRKVTCLTAVFICSMSGFSQMRMTLEDALEYSIDHSPELQEALINLERYKLNLEAQRASLKSRFALTLNPFTPDATIVIIIAIVIAIIIFVILWKFRK